MQSRHLASDLPQMQSLPLETKNIMTQRRIQQWYEYWYGDVYVGLSGGDDSTVLKHIVDGMYKDVPAVFVNTGLEYPEIQKFVREIKAGKYECFNSDVEILRPEMRFDEVVKHYGYPAVSKMVAHSVDIARRNPEGRVAQNMFAAEKTGRFAFHKWQYLIDAPFCVSDKCCNVMKKKPSEKYAKETGRKPMLGTLAEESALRYANWLKHGCNAFQGKNPSSQPMSFWTKQDVLHYIKKYSVPYCSVYGDIVYDIPTDIEGQMNLFEVLSDYEETGDFKLKTTGCDRTGCIFCMFGCHLEKSPNRFQRLKETHPNQYKYCIGGGEMVDGKWQPNEDGLGLAKVLDYIGVEYK